MDVELFHCEVCGKSKLAGMPEIVRLGRAHQHCQHIDKFKWEANIRSDATGEGT